MTMIYYLSAGLDADDNATRGVSSALERERLEMVEAALAGLRGWGGGIDGFEDEPKGKGETRSSERRKRANFRKDGQRGENR